MKIISIHWGLSLGGVAKYAATLEGISKFIPVTIRSVCILMPGRGIDNDVLNQLDVEIVEIKSIFDISWIAKVKHIISKHQPNCILSHGFNGHFVSLLTGHGLCRIATYHGSYHAPSLLRRMVKPFYNAFTHWFLRNKAKSILNVAQYCAEYLERKGVKHDKLEVVHNGIVDYKPAPDIRDSIRSEWNFTPEHTLIGVASRLEPIKGIEYLIEAFAQITERFPDARLVIMGDGTVREALESQAKSFGIKNQVLFTGMRSDIPDCLSAIDIFTLPSLSEAHSIGLLEAMRAELPIIATDVGGNTESVRDELEGIVIKSADRDGLANAFDRLLSNKGLQIRLASAARQKFISEFTEEVMLRKTASWITKVCSS